jgi:hypothetical protein
MKTYGDLISEIRQRTDTNETMTICDVLSHRDPPRVVAYAGWDADDSFRRTIIAWIMGTSRTEGREKHDRYAEVIKKTIDGCGKISGWARYSGKVYRGLVKPTKEVVANVGVAQLESIAKQHGAVLTRMPWDQPDLKPIHMPNSPDSFYSLPTEFIPIPYTYRTNLAVQSWSKNLQIARLFGTGKGSKDHVGGKGYTSLIMEYQIKTDESLNLRYLGNVAEEEIIRLKNDPIKVRALVPVEDFFGLF